MAFNDFPMRTSRALVAADPTRFGRARLWQLAAAEDDLAWSVPDDLKLFGSTFFAGFLFVSILIA